MVSPTISSSIKALPLSYADRAKKAQKIRPLPSAQPPQRITIQSPPKTSIRPNGLAATTLAQTVLAPVSNSIEDMAITMPIASSPLASSPLTNKTAQATSDLAVKALSVVAAHTSTQKSPIVNVWNVRKEQMAARSGVPSVVAYKAENGSVLKQPGSQLDAAVKLSTEVRPKSGSEPRRDIAGGPAVMRPSATTGNNDSSVILSPSHSLHVQPLSTESWPEVGKASSTVAEGSTSKESDDNINGSVEHSLPPVISPRKSAFLLSLIPACGFSISYEDFRQHVFFDILLSHCPYLPNLSLFFLLSLQMRRRNGFPFLLKNSELLQTHC